METMLQVSRKHYMANLEWDVTFYWDIQHALLSPVYHIFPPTPPPQLGQPREVRPVLRACDRDGAEGPRRVLPPGLLHLLPVPHLPGRGAVLPDRTRGEGSALRGLLREVSTYVVVDHLGREFGDQRCQLAFFFTERKKHASKFWRNLRFSLSH